MQKTRITITNSPNETDLGRVEELRKIVKAVGLYEEKDDDDNFVYRSKAKAKKALVETRKELIKKNLWVFNANICHHSIGMGLDYYNATAGMSDVLSD